MALPQYKMNHDDVLEQADVTRERLDWLHSREVRSSEAHDWADIFAEPASSERALPDIRGRRGGNERAIVHELDDDASDADVFKEIMR
jgi:hypothetical protein